MWWHQRWSPLPKMNLGENTVQMSFRKVKKSTILIKWKRTENGSICLSRYTALWPSILQHQLLTTIDTKSHVKCLTCVAYQTLLLLGTHLTLYQLQNSQVGPVCETLLPHGAYMDHRDHLVGCRWSRLLLVYPRFCQPVASSLHICHILLQEECAKASEVSFGLMSTIWKDKRWEMWRIFVWSNVLSPTDSQH